MAACNVPYVVSASESQPLDFMSKAAKAQKIASEEGFVYFKTLSACPLNWNDDPSSEPQVIQAAVESCYFPLYEVENGSFKMSLDVKNPKPVREFITKFKKFRHLTDEDIDALQELTDRKIERLHKLCTL